MDKHPLETEKAFFSNLTLLAASYLPGWKYDPEGAEPASALLRVCAELLWDTRTRSARLFEKHEMEFLNCLSPKRRYAEPPCCRLAFSLGAGEALLKKGTRLYAAEGERITVFSLRHSLGVNGLRLSSLLFESPILQKAVRALPPKAGGEPLSLFDFHREGLYRQEIRFFHTEMFCSKKESLLRLSLGQKSGEVLLRTLGDSQKLSWSLEGKGGEIRLPLPLLQGKELLFYLPGVEADCLKCRCLPGTVPPAASFFGAFFKTRRDPVPPERILCDGEEVEAADFLPFGRELSPYSECLLGADDILRHRGSRVSLSFTLGFQQTVRELPRLSGEAELRYVMRRPKTPPQPLPRQVYADEVRLEYYNGKAWTGIPGIELSRLFSHGEEGPKQLAFLCPIDISPCFYHGEERRWLRLRLLRAENSGWLPCIFHAPRLSDLTLSCSYELPCPPQKITRTGVDGEKVIAPSELQKGILLFDRISGEADALYFGFDRKPPSPFRLYLELSEQRETVCKFSYSRKDGSFSPLEVQDRTGGLAHSGELSFSVPEDFAAVKRCGETLWWLRLEDVQGCIRESAGLPSLLGCFPCSVEADCEEELAQGAVPIGTPFLFLEGCCPAEAWSVTSAYGGCPPESAGQARLRTEGELRRQNRAVTLSDLERLLCEEVRDVARVRCFFDREKGLLTAAVLMRDFENRQEAFGRRGAELLRLVEDCTGLAAMGARCRLRQPDLIRVRVTAWLRGVVESPAEQENEVLSVLEQFLHPVRGSFDGMGWPIGMLPLRDQLLSCLRLSFPDLTVEELVLSRYRPETGGEEELELSRGQPFVLTASGPHSVHLRTTSPNADWENG